ncbi:MAG TPA: hypothetical protein VJ866_05835 [Pyrinomonadaceae bacterium]|nr:hypothetical protein [Pyrinomonadaceae bacterium]
MSEMETALKVRELVGRQIDELIRAASRKMELLEGSEMERSQVRNLVNLAAASKSVEEVTNFIRYQIGRDTKGKTWGYNGFGKAVIADIETGQVRKALVAVFEKVPEADLVIVRSELIALYLGYLNRCFIYAKEEKDWRSFDASAAGGEGAGANG